MKLVYLAHPYGGAQKNLDRARRWLRWAWRDHAAADIGFLAPWIDCCEALPETPDNRERVIVFDENVIGMCDAVWLVGGEVTPGMKLEADHATALHVEVIDMTRLGAEPPG